MLREESGQGLFKDVHHQELSLQFHVEGKET